MEQADRSPELYDTTLELCYRNAGAIRLLEPNIGYLNTITSYLLNLKLRIYPMGTRNPPKSVERVTLKKNKKFM